MWRTRAKYGFVTTYDEAIFLKQEKHSEEEKGLVLWYSNVIRFDAASCGLTTDADDLVYWHGRVSLRNCFLFHAHKAQNMGVRRIMTALVSRDGWVFVDDSHGITISLLSSSWG